MGAKIPQAKLRIGIYGHFALLRWSQIFDGAPPPLTFIGEEELPLG